MILVQVKQYYNIVSLTDYVLMCRLYYYHYNLQYCDVVNNFKIIHKCVDDDTSKRSSWSMNEFK